MRKRNRRTDGQTGYQSIETDDFLRYILTSEERSSSERRRTAHTAVPLPCHWQYLGIIDDMR